MKPIINLNGQSAAVHVADRRKAIDALQAAFTAVAALRPHGRDYPGADEQYTTDLAEHTKWLDYLNLIERDVMQDALAIQKGNV